jgi:hypothetical protein
MLVGISEAIRLLLTFILFVENYGLFYIKFYILNKLYSLYYSNIFGIIQVFTVKEASVSSNFILPGVRKQKYSNLKNSNSFNE